MCLKVRFVGAGLAERTMRAEALGVLAVNSPVLLDWVLLACGRRADKSADWLQAAGRGTG